MANDWTCKTPTEDGVYLTKFDRFDDDDEAEEFHLKGGKFYKDGEPWVAYGGVWRRIADLPAS